MSNIKNKVFLIIITIVFTTILVIGFFNLKNKNNEVIKLSVVKSYDIVHVEDKAVVEDLKSIYANIVYENNIYENIINGLTSDENEKEYKMWLESQNSNERIFNIEFWIKKDKIYVFDKNNENINERYGYVKEERNKLVEILKKYIET